MSIEAGSVIKKGSRSVGFLSSGQGSDDDGRTFELLVEKHAGISELGRMLVSSIRSM